MIQTNQFVDVTSAVYSSQFKLLLLCRMLSVSVCIRWIIVVILSGLSLSCYQCDSRFDPDCKEKFDHEHIDQLIIRPTECTVDAAQYCIKTIGVWGGN